MTEKKRPYINVAFRILTLVVRMSPGWIALDCFAMLLSSVCYAYATVVKQWLFDTITKVANGEDTYQGLLIVTILVVIFQIGNELLNAVCNFTWSPALRSTVGKIVQKIHLKVKRLPANAFEDVACLECIEKANVGADNCYGLYNSVATILLFYFPYFIVIGVYLWKLAPVLILALVFIFIPLVINLIVRQHIYEKQIDEIVPVQRERDYYETEIFSRENLKENRLYGTFCFFYNKYKESNKKFCDLKWETVKKSGIIELFLRCLTLIGYLGVIVLLLVYMLNGTISVGAFAAVFSSISTLITFMNDAIGNYLGSLFENMGSLRRLLDFFDLQEETYGEGDVNWKNDVLVNNISFSYPGTKNKVLDNVSFRIKGNETIALVGENGAGKSTLIRVLLGILHPDYGNVCVNGINIHEVNTYDRFRKASAVFQKFIRYQLTVRENVQISSSEENEDEFINSLNRSEFQMDERFVDGYGTILSKEFGGIDLSGGQWQRLALARGLYRNSDFIVLDEPTSAIDPIEEGILYRKFQHMIEGKKGIIVTHRLGSARLADRILVLKEGKLIEEGSHEELMELGGEYAMLYSEQAKWYKEKGNAI